MGDFWHTFFTYGLMYSSFFSIFMTIKELSRWFFAEKKPDVRATAFSVDPAASHGEEGERQVDCALREAGIPALRNVFIHSPAGRLTEIDLLALVGSTILVIEVKAWAGQVFGKSADEDWVQRKHCGIIKEMKNPLHQNRHHLRALRQAHPKARNHGIVVFTEAGFPDGWPNGAVDIPDLLDLIEKQRKAVPDTATMLAWGKLSACSGQQDKIHLHDTLVAQVHGRKAVTLDRPFAFAGEGVQ